MGLKFRKGGGYLNEVDAEIVGYTWLVGEETEIKSGNRKGQPFTPLSLVPQFQVDGEDDVKERRLLLGDAAAYGDVTDDDQVLQTPDGQQIGEACEVGVFLRSAIEADPAFGDLIPDDDSAIDLRPIIGTRVRLVMEVNSKRKEQKGKDGKMYPARDLKVASVHSLPSAKPAKGAKAGKAAPAGKAAKAVSVDAEAVTVLKAILEDAKDNTILKTKLSMAVLRTAKGANKEAVREWLFDDDNLSDIEGVTYNVKKGTITLDE